MLIHELSPEVRAVAELFMRCQPGEVVTFPEMSALGLIEHIARDSNVKPGPEASTKPQPVAVTARALLAALDAK